MQGNISGAAGASGQDQSDQQINQQEDLKRNEVSHFLDATLHKEEKPIEYKHAECSLYTIQKVSQILE